MDMTGVSGVTIRAKTWLQDDLKFRMGDIEIKYSFDIIIKGLIASHSTARKKYSTLSVCCPHTSLLNRPLQIQAIRQIIFLNIFSTGNFIHKSHVNFLSKFLSTESPRLY